MKQKREEKEKKNRFIRNIRTMKELNCIKNEFLDNLPNVGTLCDIRKKLNNIIKATGLQKMKFKAKINLIKKRREEKIILREKAKVLKHEIKNKMNSDRFVFLEYILNYIYENGVCQIIYNYVYDMTFKIIHQNQSQNGYLYTGIKDIYYKYSDSSINIYDMFSCYQIDQIKLLFTKSNFSTCKYISTSIENKIWIYHKTSYLDVIEEFDISSKMEPINKIILKEPELLKNFGYNKSATVCDVLYDNGYLYFFDPQFVPITLFEIDYKTYTFSKTITVPFRKEQLIIKGGNLYILEKSKIIIYDTKTKSLEKKDQDFDEKSKYIEILITKELAYTELCNHYDMTGIDMKFMNYHDHILCIRENRCILFSILSVQTQKYIMEYDFHNSKVIITNHIGDITGLFFDIKYYNDCYFLRTLDKYYVISKY